MGEFSSSVLAESRSWKEEPRFSRVQVLAELSSPLQVLQYGVSPLRRPPHPLQSLTLALVGLLQSTAAAAPHQGFGLQQNLRDGEQNNSQS